MRPLLRLTGLGVLSLVGLIAVAALGEEPPAGRLTGWVYAVSAPPLADAYADPGGRLSDGEHGRDHTAIWRGGTVTVEVTLARPATVMAVRVYQHRHNLNYQLSYLAVQCRVGGQWEEHGRLAEGFVGPTPSMDFTHTVLTGGVTTDALRLEFVGVGVLSVSEIELFGEPLTPTSMAGGAYRTVPFAGAAEATASELDLDGDGQAEVVLENAWVRLVITPGRGGICRSLRLKQPDTELIGSADPAFGLFRDQLWKPDYSFADRTYFHRLQNEPDAATVELWTSGVGGMLSFTEVRKALTLRRESSVVAVHYTLTNQPSSQTTYEYGIWFHNWLGDPNASSNTYVFPTLAGVQEFRLDSRHPDGGGEAWYRDPARGWTAVYNEHGTGLAIQLPYRYLNCFYRWHGAGSVAATHEWRFNLLTLKAGEKIEADLRLIPFSDLPRIQDVCNGGGVGAFTGSATEVTASLWVPHGLEVSTADLEVSRAGTPAAVARTTRTVTAGKTNRIAVPVPTADDLSASVTLGRDGETVGVIAGQVDTATTRAPVPLAAAGPQEGRKEDTGPGRDEHRIGTTVVTAHIPWAKPLPGGPIKALVLMDDMNSREAVELAQRLDLDLDYVKFRTTLETEYLWQGDLSIQTLASAQKRLLQRLQQQRYEVLLLAGFRWDFHLTAELRDLIVERVHGGMGLLLIQPDGFSRAEAERLPPAGVAAAGLAARQYHAWHRWAPAGQDPLTAGLDWTRFPLTRRQDFEVPPAGTVLATVGEDRAPLLIAADAGQGRVLCATWDTLTHEMSYRGYSALTPILSYRGGWLRPEFANLPRGYHEWWFALLARLVVQAAGRDTGAALVDAPPVRGPLDAPPTVSIRVTCKKETQNATVETHWQSADGKAQTTSEDIGVLEAGDNTLSLHPPPTAVTVGDNTACFILRDRRGAALAWGFTTLSLGAPNRLKALTLVPDILLPAGGMWQPDTAVETKEFEPEKPLQALATLDGPAATAFLAHFSFADTRGRVLHEVACPIAVGATTVTAEMPILPLVDQGIEVTVELTLGERLQDRRQARAIAFSPRVWKRFGFTSWGGQFLWRSRYLFDDVSRLVRNYGIDVSFVGDTELSTDKGRENAYWGINPSWLGLLGYLGKGVPDFGDAQFSAKAAAYAKTKDKVNLERTPCLVDPQWRSQVAARLSERATRLLPWGGAVDYCMGDEMSLTHYTQFHDYDWSPASLTDFRRWLQTRYPDLGSLNQAWGTQFADWTAVLPLTREEARAAANPAPWCEFRLYMNDQLADFCRFVQTTLRAVDPNARCGLSGTQSPEAGNGMDWWNLSQAFSYYHSYNTSWSNELRRSFQDLPGGADQSPYFSGYSVEGPACERRLWWCLFHDTRGISCWKTDLFFYGDLTRTASGQDTFRHLQEFRSGVWRLLRGARRQHDGIAILYSMPSIIVGALTGEEKRINAYRDAWVKLIEDSGLQYEFIAAEQLANGRLDRPGFRLLVLPHSMALSATEAAAVTRFVRDGGSVFATVRPGVCDELGRKQSPALLDGLFQVRQDGAPHAVQPGIVLGQAVGDLAAGTAVLLAPALTDLALDGGSALATSDAGRVPVLIRGTGGRAVLWNLDLTDLEQERRFHSPTEKALRELLTSELARLGLAPRFPVALTQGRPAHVETVVYDLDGTSFLCLLNWDDEACQAAIQLGQVLQVCDVRAGRDLGRFDRLDIPLEPGGARLFALGKTAPCRPLLRADPADAPRGMPLTVTVSLQTAPDRAKPPRQLVRLDVTDGTDRSRPEYRQTVWLSDTPQVTRIPLALNDPAGIWTLTATDVSSGATVSLPVKIH